MTATGNPIQCMTPTQKKARQSCYAKTDKLFQVQDVLVLTWTIEQLRIKDSTIRDRTTLEDEYQTCSICWTDSSL
jgi:hypothetical protein